MVETHEIRDEVDSMNDPVNHPQHYTSNPFPLETIDITKHYDFCIGNALKYVFRHEHKGNPKQDLEKAIWYLQKKLEEYDE